MTRHYYELRHFREDRYITCSTFESARSAFAYQWRDPNGVIPWRMFEVINQGRFDPTIEEEINPWTGLKIKPEDYINGQLVSPMCVSTDTKVRLPHHRAGCTS